MKSYKKLLSVSLIICILLSLTLFNIASQAADTSNVILAKNAVWKYLDNGVDLGKAFIEEAYDDKEWKKGQAPLGYGDDFSETDPSLPIATKINYGKDDNKYMTSYFRTSVDVKDLSAYNALEIYIHVDDGAVVYFNGKEAFRRGIDEGVDVKYDTSAKFKPKEETFILPVTLLKTGVNVIAAEVHNDDPGSSDLWFEISIKCVKAKTDALLTKNAEWKYMDNGQDLGKAFAQENYDDKPWMKGKAPLGFGDDFSETDPSLPLATKVNYGKDDNKYMTTYFRTTFDVVKLSDYIGLQTYIHVDDGAVVYINGKEAFRRGIAEGVDVKYDTSAKFKPKEETFVLPLAVIKEGVNTVAVEVHQDDPGSSDLWFEMSIMGITKTTDGQPVEVKPITVPDPKAEKGIVSKVTVTFFGDVTKSKGFTWYTTAISGNSDLQVVEKTGQTKIANFTKATKYKGKYGISKNSPKEVFHKAEATNLKAGTEYFFRVGDEKVNLWSTVGTFKTASKNGAFTFVNLADSQAKSQEEAVLSAGTFAAAMKTVKAAEFLSINGDIVDVGMQEQQWDWVFGAAKTTLMNTTFVPAAGNHDEDLNAFAEHFNLKAADKSSTDRGVYYSYDYKNAHFIVLNNNEDSEEYANFSKAQIEWLKNDVKGAKTKGAKWIIAMMHKGPYTTSNHATDGDIMGENGVRTKFAPLAESLGIDLVLQGHDHIYARTKPIYNGKAVTTKTINEKLNSRKIEYAVKPSGTIYLIPATAGPKTYYKNKKIEASYFNLFNVADENHAAKYGSDPGDSSRPLRGVIQNFVSITINGNKLTAVTYEIDQQKKDKSPYIVDQFGIIK